jgi:hypothetical protein
MLKLKKIFYDRRTYVKIYYILNLMEYLDARLLVLILFEQPSYIITMFVCNAND